ncbi:hypothetical protein EON65_47855 [archaeon]|nr:MAG: hypothetical protein EON65_47855 [archaeon]
MLGDIDRDEFERRVLNAGGWMLTMFLDVVYCKQVMDIILMCVSDSSRSFKGLQVLASVSGVNSLNQEPKLEIPISQ